MKKKSFSSHCVSPSEWIDYKPYWCKLHVTELGSPPKTEQQCKDLCGPTCKGVTWWEKSEKRCEECHDLSSRERYDITDDPSYPPHVLAKKGNKSLSSLEKLHLFHYMEFFLKYCGKRLENPISILCSMGDFRVAFHFCFKASQS